MKRLEQIIAVIKSIGAVALAYCAVFLKEVVAMNHVVTFYSVAAVVSILLIHLLDHLLHSAFKHSKKLRRMVIGDDFIEGCWIDRVDLPRLHAEKLSAPCGYAILTITWNGDFLVSRGVNYILYPDGSLVEHGNWHSKASMFHEAQLVHVYEAEIIGPDKKPIAGVVGHGKYNFQTPPDGGAPFEYTGYTYYQAGGDKPLRIKGRRVVDRDILCDMKEKPGKIKAIRSVWQSINMGESTPSSQQK